MNGKWHFPLFFSLLLLLFSKFKVWITIDSFYRQLWCPRIARCYAFGVASHCVGGFSYDFRINWSRHSCRSSNGDYVIIFVSLLPLSISIRSTFSIFRTRIFRNQIHSERFHSHNFKRHPLHFEFFNFFFSLFLFHFQSILLCPL